MAQLRMCHGLSFLLLQCYLHLYNEKDTWVQRLRGYYAFKLNYLIADIFAAVDTTLKEDVCKLRNIASYFLFRWSCEYW